MLMFDMEAPSAKLPLLSADHLRVFQPKPFYDLMILRGFHIFVPRCSSMVPFTQNHYTGVKEADTKKTFNSIVPVVQGRG